MPTTLPIYLMDANGIVWLIWVQNNGQLVSSPTVLTTAPTFFLLLDSASSQAWSVGILLDGHLDQPQATALPTTTKTLLFFAPNNSTWVAQIVNGQLETVASPSGIPCLTPISTLAPNVLNRLEENVTSPIFWNLQTEIYSALVEAMNDFLLLVGRPTQAVNVPITLTPNTVWQTLPKGIFLITNLYGQQGEIRKSSLFAYDYIQSGNNGSDWENDVAATPRKWFPIGFNLFGVHPAPSSPIQLTLTGLQYPVSTLAWPFSGNESIPFHHECFSALEEYATHYARIKEMGADFEEGVKLYQQYLSLAQRFTTIEDKRDPVVFSRTIGGQTRVSPITKR